MMNIKKNLVFLVVVGGQWGDEGKGKIVDYLSNKQFDIICRFSGGDNAGHTIVIDEEKHKFSLLPVSVIQENKISIIGSGCLVNLKTLIKELDNVIKINPKVKLWISEKVHLIFPFHILEDKAEEYKKNKEEKIGTTQRGIGPCSKDRTSRIGIQIGEMFDKEHFKKRLKNIVNYKNLILSKLYGEKYFTNYDLILKEWLELFEKIKNRIINVNEFLNKNKNKNILFEGAQGTMLDPQFGFYPFVTSTPTTYWGAGLGSEIKFDNLETLGIFKSYSTRVGTGPMPTEFKNEISEKIVKIGNEFGTVTGRKRRIGWFDVVIAKYSVQINGFKKISLMLLDVLTGISKIKICTSYKMDGKEYNSPIFFTKGKKIECEYIELNGWSEDITNIKEYKKLPLNARKYIEKIEELLNVKISFISVGPERKQIIIND